MKKYRLTDETKEVYGRILYRIQALKNIGSDVKKGDYGGYIESVKNLSQEGMCWIKDDACVFEDACVEDNALICDNARVYGKALVIGNVLVADNARIYDEAYLSENCNIYGYAMIYNNAVIEGNCSIYERARVFERGLVGGNATLFDHANVHGNAEVYGRACLYNNATVTGRAIVKGEPIFKEHALIKSTNDYLVIGPVGKNANFITFYQTEKGLNVCLPNEYMGDLNTFEEYLNGTKDFIHFEYEEFEKKSLEFAKAYFKIKNLA